MQDCRWFLGDKRDEPGPERSQKPNERWTGTESPFERTTPRARDETRETVRIRPVIVAARRPS